MTRIVALAIIVPVALFLFALGLFRGIAGEGWETLFLLLLGGGISAAAWARNRFPEL